MASDKKNSNLEILKIIAIYWIISGHMMIHTGTYNIIDNYSIVGIFSWFYKSIFVLSVNLFVITSGFFLVKSKFKINKIVKMWTIIWTLSVIFSIIGYLCLKFYKDEVYNLLLIKSFFPLFSNQYWYITTYFVLYLFSGFLNKLIYACDKNNLKHLLILCFIIFSVWSSIWPSSLDRTGGFGIIWFIILYLTGAYIRLYGINISGRFELFYLLAYLFIMLSIKYISLFIGNTFIIGFDSKVNAVMYKYNFPLVYIASIMFFYLFAKHKKVSYRYEKLIHSVASSTLSIYIIHEHPLIRKFLWGLVDIENYSKNVIFFIFLIITLPFIVMVICYFVEIFRKKLFVIINIDSLESKISYKIREKIRRFCE